MPERKSMRAAAQRRIKGYMKPMEKKKQEGIPKIEGQIGTGKKHFTDKGKMR